MSLTQAAGVEAHFSEFVRHARVSHPDLAHGWLNAARAMHPFIAERVAGELDHVIDAKRRFGLPLPAKPAALRTWHCRRALQAAGADVLVIWNRTAKAKFALDAMGERRCIHWEHGAAWDAGREAERRDGRPPKYSGRCRALTRDESARRLAAGEPAAIRFAVPTGRDVSFHDLVRGDVTFGAEVLGDFVILRSDGRPAYNFAVVVDDAQMEITHVVRGEDHISNTPRQLLIYDALGFAPPLFAHLSLVLGPDHAPLSKRHGATSVAEFRERGVLPEALFNYLALLGWSPGANEELVSAAEMARRFDLSGVSHSAAVFDTAKLAWINRHYMKDAGASRLAREALKYFVRAGYVTLATDASLAYVESLLPMGVGSVDWLDELPSRVAFLFEWDAARAADLARAEPDGARAVAAFAAEIEHLGPLDQQTFRAAAGRVRAATGLKGRALFHPIRVALTAAESGPELDLAVPAIDRGAGLPRGVVPIASCAERAAAVARDLEAGR